MENGSLEDLWKAHAWEWDFETRQELEEALRPSTRANYNGLLTRFQSFCSQHGYSSFPAEVASIAHFFNVITKDIERPGPTLLLASAAISSTYKGAPFPDPTKDELLKLLKQALVNTRTKRPRTSPQVFPIDKLTSFITSMGENEKLNPESLRLKTVALLAIAGLYRPSDLVRINVVHISFNDESMVIDNWGGKTDKNMDGQPSTISKASEPLLCPVSVVKHYITSTLARRHRDEKGTHLGALFIHLKSGQPLSIDTVSNLLDTVLHMAGIEEASAKMFRKTGASAAIQAGVHPDLVMKLGR
jgi:integrase